MRTVHESDQERARKLAERSHRLLDATLDQIMALLDAQRGAIFRTSPDGVALVASRNLDQRVLDIVRPLWPHAPRPLMVGSAYFGLDVGRAYMVLPCLAPDILGLLYVDTPGPLTRVPAGHLSTISALVGRALRGLTAPGDPDPKDVVFGADPDDAERASLVVVLERNEWNVSRVARLLGVTRMTIYNRLRRLGVPRERSAGARPPAG